MNTWRAIAVTAFITWGVAGCNNQNNKTQLTQPVIQDTSAIANLTASDTATTFHKVLTLQNITFDIRTVGKGSIRQLYINLSGLKDSTKQITAEIEGQTMNAEIEDLNSDGFPEVLIYTQSAGSGSYGNVIGYSVNNGQSVSQIYFPPIAENENAKKGYMGHDEFAIVENSLIQRFPIYKDGDTNSKPTGNIRQIQYKLKNGEASRKFVIDKIVEIPVK